MECDSQKTVLIPIANGSESMEVVITIDVLRRAGADVYVASVEEKEKEDKYCVEASHGVKIVADVLIRHCDEYVFDLISLPGGMLGATNLRDNNVLREIVKKQVAEGRMYAAISAAPVVAFGTWGLLKGLNATCYPSLMKQLSSFAITSESRVQVDGNSITSRGPGTAMEYSVKLVEQLYGKKKADEVSGPLLMISKQNDQFVVGEWNKLQWTCTSVPKILVPIANGSEVMQVVMIIDVLRRAKAKVVVASVGNKLEIVASHNVALVADMLLDEAAESSYDLIVLPGGIDGAKAFANSKTLVNLLKKQGKSDRYYAAMCESVVLVPRPHGLHEGKSVTAFPAMCNKLSALSEAVNGVVVDGKSITGIGAVTLEFPLAIVEKLFGRDKALEIAKVRTTTTSMFFVRLFQKPKHIRCSPTEWRITRIPDLYIVQ